jgi:hypothetical protein
MLRNILLCCYVKVSHLCYLLLTVARSDKRLPETEENCCNYPTSTHTSTYIIVYQTAV